MLKKGCGLDIVQGDSIDVTFKITGEDFDRAYFSMIGKFIKKEDPNNGYPYLDPYLDMGIWKQNSVDIDGHVNTYMYPDWTNFEFEQEFVQGSAFKVRIPLSITKENGVAYCNLSVARCFSSIIESGEYHYDIYVEKSIRPSMVFNRNYRQTPIYSNVFNVLRRKQLPTSVFEDYSVYGVRWVNDESITMTRTDDAVGLESPMFTTTERGVECYSPFDYRFPWNEAKKEVINGNVMLHMPEMWFRVETDPNAPSEIISVAVSKRPKAIENWYKVKDFYYGCYGACNIGNVLYSKPGRARSDSITHLNFSTYAKANGPGYTQLDLYHHTVMLFLWWIEFARKDARNIANGQFRGVISGSGSIGGSAYVNTGGTDILSTPTGYETTRNQMRWHYIEDFVGNKLEWVDGVISNSRNNRPYVTSNPAKYTNDSSDMELASYNSPNSSNFCIHAFGWDPSKPFLMMPTRSESDDSWNSGFQNAASVVSLYMIYVGAYASDNGLNRGVCFSGNGGTSSTTNYLGSRLLKSKL